MVLVKTPLDFIDRSIRLLQAHPDTTRITTTYNISPAPTTPSRRPKPTSSLSKQPTEEKPKAPRGTLTLKTYDPISGSLVKLRTDKISDVGRIVTGLHRLARSMAGLKDLGSGEVTGTAAAAGGATAEAAGPSVTKDADAGAVAATEGGEAAAGGSKGGKKKNKKKK
ncbi:uncharacterized protein DFL_008601 [Arthrobotrys flagrans]|uniref:SRP9 domain-containing protein n=1 Tax=Arthrobotrys flagrans TaxID=97331 RepID=A0A436ZP77_ARTFL|nr:hypothetical protein DFL_008601 [Arthrobotrys flagrans]